MDEKRVTLESWVDKYSLALMNRAFFLISDRQDAEDIVQDVFLVAFESYDSYKGESQAKTWLMSILKNKVADYYRKKYKTHGQIPFSDFFDQSGSWKENDVLRDWATADDSLLNDKEFRLRFEKCLNALPPKWAILVKLYYLEEKKADAICQDLDVSSTNLWKILQRSRMQLRKCIEINWFNN